MKYILMQKNYPVMEIEMDTDSGRITGAACAAAPERVPLGIAMEDGKPDINAVRAWWSRRAVPASRSGIGRALEELGLQSTEALLSKCMGLSLSDQYWVKPDNSTVRWEDVNFFDNDFSDDVGDILFGSKPGSQTLDMMTPDGSSDGWLRKKWKIINGERCLIKGGSGFFQEPFNEVIAYRISRRLGISHVPYSLSHEGGNLMPVSVCADFVTRDTELITAAAITRILPAENGESRYDHFARCCEKLCIPDFGRSLDEMLILDYIIANQDRHTGNFGALRNADTLEFIGFSPLYDCGTSLRYDTPAVYIDPELNVESQPFMGFHDQQIGLVKDGSAFDREKLIGIDSEIREIFSDSRAQAYIDCTRSEKIISVVMRRIEMIDKIFCGNKN